ncbi:MAG: hypothetical protein ACRC8G_08995 [Plesiomonas shigelloides]
MSRGNDILRILESKETEANARAEFVANFVELNRSKLIAGEMDTDVATLLAEVDFDEAACLNQAAHLLMKEGEPGPMMQLINKLIDDELAALADEAWGYHLAELHDAMSAEQWDRYNNRGEE